MKPLESLIQRALQEDAVSDDVTTSLLGEAQNKPARAVLKAKKPGTFSGVAYVEAFQRVWGESLNFTAQFREGQCFAAGDILVKLVGTVGQVLRAERTLINGLSHSCGVATLTAQYVKQLEGLPTILLATRKTLPGLRDLELPAVAAGGGRIHRRSLCDGILIKENHQAWASESELVGVAKKARSPLHRIEIEVQDFAGLDRALTTKPDVILLDNFSVADLKRAVQVVAGRCDTEASGGVNLETVRAIAEAGVTAVSVGALTHSVTALDISLDFEERAP